MAVFTPQAGATAAVLVPPEDRGRALATTFLGWSIASVLALPLGAWIAGTLGWRAVFAAAALLAALAAVAVYATVPRGLKAQPLNMRSWSQVLRNPVLPLVLFVTVVQASGQFSVFPYIAPLLSHAVGEHTSQRALLLTWCGLFGVLGNAWVARHVDRIGADRIAAIMITLIAIGLAVLGLAHADVWTTALAHFFWGAGIFGVNSAQQARLVVAAPSLASASIALNTSTMFLGQAIGAWAGGTVLAGSGIGTLPWFAAGGMLAALMLSHAIAIRSQRLQPSA